jgi:hypothetical protein
MVYAGAFLGFILWVVLSFIVATGARNRERSGAGWFLMSFFLSPVFAGFALLILGENPSAKPVPVPENQESRSIGPGRDWKCPKCYVENSSSTYQCKGCGYSLT